MIHCVKFKKKLTSQCTEIEKAKADRINILKY